jgi:hypothetical protein
MPSLVRRERCARSVSGAIIHESVAALLGFAISVFLVVGLGYGHEVTTREDSCARVPDVQAPRGDTQIICRYAAHSFRRAREGVCCLITLDNVAAIFAMGVNDPAPAIAHNGAAIAPRETGCTKLVSDHFPVFHLGRNVLS